MKIDEVVMFTSEISAVELNTIRPEGLTLLIPENLEVDLVTHTEGVTYIHLSQKAE